MVVVEKIVGVLTCRPFGICMLDTIGFAYDCLTHLSVLLARARAHARAEKEQHIFHMLYVKMFKDKHCEHSEFWMQYL